MKKRNKTIAIVSSIALVLTLGASAVAAPIIIENQKQNVTAAVTLDEAKNTALTHAGVKSSDAVFTEAVLDRDNGKSVYDIEFYSGNREYDYEIDAATGKIREYDFDIENFSVPTQSTSQTTTSPAPQSGSAQSSTQNGSAAASALESAKAAALKDAGLSASEVSFIKAKLDYDDGREVYDIEFYSGNREYDYEIDAATGRIIERDFDIEYDYRAPAASIATTQNVSGTGIGLESAKAAALKSAGVSADNATFTKAVLDYDDGLRIYDIEFYTSSHEYEYEINAANGAILERDIEAIRTAPTASADFISAEQAKSIALSRAGLTASDVSYIKAEFDRDDGRAVYEVEFKNGMFEYSCEINAVNGTVLDWEKEIDD